MDIKQTIEQLDDECLWLMYTQIGAVIGRPENNKNFFFWFDLFGIVDHEANKRLAENFNK